MGKATVESSLRLDAHFWASATIRQAARQLARRFVAAKAGEVLGTSAAARGLIEMSWTRGGTTPAGSIHWGVLSEQEDQIKELLLVFQVTSSGRQHPRRQTVTLDWNTPAGKPSRLPVLRCPFCERRCRFLCAAYPGRQGGPYLGEFACRQCAGLCYAQQLEYQGAWARNFGAINKLLDKSRLHPERLTEADAERAWTLTQAPMSFGSRVDKIIKRMEAAGSEEDRDTDARRVWDVLPPPVFSPPKRRGRPSPKRQRKQARECAKIVREAEQQARPKRPAGRPKAKREYDAAGRQQHGCGGKLGLGDGYCVSCRAGRPIIGAEAFTASNGRGGIKGKCAECGRGLCRLGGAMFTDSAEQAI